LESFSCLEIDLLGDTKSMPDTLNGLCEYLQISTLKGKALDYNIKSRGWTIQNIQR